MAQSVKKLAILAYLGEVVHVWMAVLLIQFPNNMPRKAAADGNKSSGPCIHMGDWRLLQTPGFGLAQSWPMRPFGERTSHGRFLYLNLPLSVTLMFK